MNGEKRHAVALQEPLLDARAAGKLLNVPASTIYEWARSGRLPTLRLGPRALRWTRPMLEQFCEDMFDPGRPR